MGEFGVRDSDALFLTEEVRTALGDQLAYAYCGMSNHLPVLLLDPVIEDTISSAIVHNANGQVLALEPEICRQVVLTIAASLQPMVAQGKCPVILTQQEIRRRPAPGRSAELRRAAGRSHHPADGSGDVGRGRRGGVSGAGLRCTPALLPERLTVARARGTLGR